jgi:methionyl-tRNA formyltransferase
MGIVLFTANKIGHMLLGELEKRKFYPDVVTYVRGFQRTGLAKDLSSFKRNFNMRFVGSNRFELCENISGIEKTNTIVCVDWTKDFFKNCDIPVIYAHPSMLPMYRGYSAVTEQFERGVTVSGASFYVQGEKIDAGNILHQSSIRIEYEDYPEEFIEKYVKACADFIIELNRKGFEGFDQTPQDESRAFYLQRKRGRDALIDFNRDAFSLYNHIRAYSRPYFGSFFMYKGERITVWRAHTEKWQGYYGEPGAIINADDNGVEIACGSGSITLLEYDGKILDETQR